MTFPRARRLLSIPTVFFLFVSGAVADDALRADPDRMQQRIEALAEFGANAEGGVAR